MKIKGLGGILIRYVVAAIGVGIFLLLFNIVILIQILYTAKPDKIIEDRIKTIAAGVAPLPDGAFSVSEDARQALNERYEWAMLLDDNGDVIWEDRMPEELPRRYTAPEVASFTHWYLQDYPVYCWRNDSGLMVMASAPGSEWKYTFTMREQTLKHILASLPIYFLCNVLAALALALLLGWRMYCAIEPIANGIHHLAQGETISLPERGVLRMLAIDLNRASQMLLKQRTTLQKRDRTRTEWIAGVSHDIRTPLSLVQGSAAQLENNSALSQETRDKASLIRIQSQRIERLIYALNLTSKLTYEMQPLHLAVFRPASMLRTVVADASNGYAAETDISLSIPPSGNALQATGDETLLIRAVDNLLYNSIAHNNADIKIQVSLSISPDNWTITVSDNGSGLDDAQLTRLRQRENGVLPTHGLGLALVRKIAEAHGGTVLFSNHEPGLSVILRFPCSSQPIL